MQKKPSDLLSKRFESSGSILLGPQKKFTWQSGKHRENWPFFTNPRKMTRKKHRNIGHFRWSWQWQWSGCGHGMSWPMLDQPVADFSAIAGPSPGPRMGWGGLLLLRKNSQLLQVLPDQPRTSHCQLGGFHGWHPNSWMVHGKSPKEKRW